MYIKIIGLVFINLLLHFNAFADNYNFYFAQSAEDSNSDGIPDTSAMTVKIVNTSTYTVYDGDLSDYYSLEYSDLEATLDESIAGTSYTADLDYTGSRKEVLDFIENINIDVADNFK